MIHVYAGLPGSGKSTMLARVSLDLLIKNKRTHEKTGYLRKVALNFKLSEKVASDFDGYFSYWSEPHTIPSFRDTDIIIDEIAIYFDAQNWADTTVDVKRFLRLHRHYGTNIYGVAQDFDTVDIAFRRLVSSLVVLTRLLGTREPSPERSPSLFPFVLSLARAVEPKDFEKKKEEYRYTYKFLQLFTNRDFNVFDTHAMFDVPEGVPYKHILRICNHEGCGYSNIVHR